MLARIHALMIKEFQALLKDRSSRLIILVPPVVQLFVFGYAATYDLQQVPYAVLDEDGGQAARELLGRLDGSRTFRLTARLQSTQEIAALVDDRKVLMVLHLGPRFTADLLAGRSAALQVIVDGRNSNTALVALGYLRTIVQGFSTRWTVARGGPPPPPRLVLRAWFNPNLESRWFIVPGIVGLLSLVVAMTVTSLSVAREREAGTFEQLLVTPLRPLEILIGKALPGSIISFAEANLIVLAAVAWFGIPLTGSLLVLYAGILLFLLSALGVGLMISSFARTQQQGLFGAFLFLTPAIILSGFVTPIANMPGPLQLVTLVNPMRYYLVILRRVFLEDASFALLWPQYAPLAVIGVLAMAVATLLFRRRMY